MIVSPKIKGFICITAHPEGCDAHVLEQIKYVEAKPLLKDKPKVPKKVLVIGCSTGYGLSSRIVSAFSMGAQTLGVCLEREPNVERNRTASAGYYNTAAFNKYAKQKNFYSKTINADAFSHETKDEVIKTIKADLGKIDMVIYSLASPKRKDPDTGEIYSSVLKPIGGIFSDKTVNTNTASVEEMTVGPAETIDIENTKKVMGGDDWILWIEKLKAADVLAKNVSTFAYSYVGPKVTQPIYRNGTIGKAKEHLEISAKTINSLLKSLEGSAYISVNKALVTQASSAIPILPLYIAILFSVMKKHHLHEGCIEQLERLFSEKVYGDEDVVVEGDMIRMDDYEMKTEIQKEVLEIWEKVNTENVLKITDLQGYR